MSVEGIRKRIMDDAKKEVKAVSDAAKKEADAVLAEGQAEADEYFERHKKLLEERYSKERDRAVLSKRLELRKKLLDRKQRWMERAFEEAYTMLTAQEDKPYRDLMIDLIAKVSSCNNEEVVFGKKGDEALLKEIIRGLNSKTGGSFTISKKRGGFDWGFILKTGRVETNMSIDSLFKYKRGDLEQRAWEIFDADVQS
jgi:vacuolar-type H+-ATPase subunit E/Vma4